MTVAGYEASHEPSRATVTIIYIKTTDIFFYIHHCSSGGGQGSNAADTNARAQWPSVTGFLGSQLGQMVARPTCSPSQRVAQHRWWIYLSWGHLSGGTRWYLHYPNGKLILPAPICVVTRFQLSL